MSKKELEKILSELHEKPISVTNERYNELMSKSRWRMETYLSRVRKTLDSLKTSPSGLKETIRDLKWDVSRYFNEILILEDLKENFPDLEKRYQEMLPEIKEYISEETLNSYKELQL